MRLVVAAMIALAACAGPDPVPPATDAAVVDTVIDAPIDVAEVDASPDAPADAPDAAAIDAPTDAIDAAAIDAAIDAPPIDAAAIDAPATDAPADAPAIDATGVDAGPPIVAVPILMATAPAGVRWYVDSTQLYGTRLNRDFGGRLPVIAIGEPLVVTVRNENPSAVATPTLSLLAGVTEIDHTCPPVLPAGGSCQIRIRADATFPVCYLGWFPNGAILPGCVVEDTDFFTTTVVLSGPGRVISSDGRIDCPGRCSFRYPRPTVGGLYIVTALFAYGAPGHLPSALVADVFPGDTRTVSFSPSPALAWTAAVPIVRAMAVAADGGMLLVTDRDFEPDPDPSRRPLRLRYVRDGIELWSRALPDGIEARVAAMPDGSFVMAPVSQTPVIERIGADGVTQWSTPLPAASPPDRVVVASDGTIFVARSVFHAHVVGMSPAGTVLWTRTGLSGPMSATADSLGVSMGMNLILTTAGLTIPGWSGTPIGDGDRVAMVYQHFLEADVLTRRALDGSPRWGESFVWHYIFPHTHAASLTRVAYYGSNQGVRLLSAMTGASIGTIAIPCVPTTPPDDDLDNPYLASPASAHLAFLPDGKLAVAAGSQAILFNASP